MGDGPVPTPGATKQYHTSGKYAAYKTPYPLSEELFLVSARTGDLGGGFMHSAHDPTLGKFKLYLMDIYGNRELLYEGDQNVLYAQPVRPRKSPAALARRGRHARLGEGPPDGPPRRVVLQQHLRRRAGGGSPARPVSARRRVDAEELLDRHRQLRRQAVWQRRAGHRLGRVGRAVPAGQNADADHRRLVGRQTHVLRPGDQR